jgi:hypothetical protein
MKTPISLLKECIITVTEDKYQLSRDTKVNSRGARLKEQRRNTVMFTALLASRRLSASQPTVTKEKELIPARVRNGRMERPGQKEKGEIPSTLSHHKTSRMSPTPHIWKLSQ